VTDSNAERRAAVIIGGLALKIAADAFSAS
jgi:hypothetical protein